MNKLVANVFCLLLLLAIGNYLNGQGTVTQVNGNAFKVDKYNDIEGSPYYFENWIPGSVYSFTGEVLENLPLNYNKHTGSFEYKKDLYTLIKLNSYEYNRVEVNNLNEKNVFLNFSKFDENHYLKLLFESNDFSVLKKEYSVIKEEELGFYNSGSSRSKFVNKIKYFIFKDEKLIEFNPKAKEISKILNSNQVKKTIKSNKLKIKKEEDLIKLFELLT